MRKFLVPTLAALLAAAVTTGIAIGAGGGGGAVDNRHFSYAIGLWGDLPYSDLQAQTGVPNLLADMNRQTLKFAVHDGDLKAGNGTVGSVTPTTCSDALFAQSLALFKTFKKAMMFTPGDNDWVDCDRPANGGFNSRERLDKQRQVFFSTGFSLGKHPLAQEVQGLSADAFCLNQAGDHVACSENRRWSVDGVTYFTMNVQGSCNNLCDTNPDPAEYAARNAANISWLKASFAKAKADGSVAVMIIAQADPGFDGSDVTRAPLRDPKTLAETDAMQGPLDGFQTYLIALRDEVTAFKNPVAYVHGDSHYFRIDKPLQNALGQRLENFTRVETFGDHQENGDNDVHWLKVLVDPTSREVFAYEPQIVPGNRIAVPAS